MTHQPTWNCVAQLGDADPIDFGGYWVLVDSTGAYAPEGEYLEPPPDDQANYDIDLLDGDWKPTARWTVYRFILEPCTWIDGILSDNPHHPAHAAWWAPRPYTAKNTTCRLRGTAETMGFELAELVGLATSADPVDRAIVYRAIGDYYGFENLDSYPLTLTEREVSERYADPHYSLSDRLEGR